MTPPSSLPRRAIAAVAATLVGLGLLFSFKTPHRARATPISATAGPAPSGGPSPTSAASASGSPSGSSSGSASSSYKDGTVTGPTEQNQWGVVQVRVTVSGGRITDVTAVQTPDDHERSLEINADATPILRQEVLTAQDAQIDTVSGATLTSDGYTASLQAALDQLQG